MKFKAKLRKIGNSFGIIIPLKVITNQKLGDEIEVEVITGRETSNVITEEIAKALGVSIERNRKLEWCDKHNAWKSTCGCK